MMTPDGCSARASALGDDAIYRARLDGDAVTDIAQRFGLSPRTVHRVISRGGAVAAAQLEEDDSPLLSLKELEQRSLFRRRPPAPPLFSRAGRYG